MRARLLLPVLPVVVAAAVLAGGPSVPAVVPAALTPVGTYDTGLGAAGAEILSVREMDDLAALTNVAGSIDLLDVSSPPAITLLRRIDVSAYGTPNSVALHPSRDYLLVASGSSGAPGQVSAWRISDGAFLAVTTVGILPDSVKISPNGRYAVVANEAEGTGLGEDGGDGTLSLIDLKAFNAKVAGTLSAAVITLPSQAGVVGFSTGRTDDLARLAITNAPSTLEPESLTFSRNSHYAYVTLQENTGVVRLDLGTRALRFFGLGQTTHLADLTTTGGYQPTQSLTSFREPDGIALIGSDRYFVTADEGDTRNGAGGSGPRGGRTVSVFNATTGIFVADTGSALDDAAAAAGHYDDGRSNRGGSEPEVLVATKFGRRTLVAVGLERASGVALLDLTDPTHPVVLAFGATGANPEGVEFLRHGARLYVLSANEAAGTVTLLRVSVQP